MSLRRAYIVVQFTQMQIIYPVNKPWHMQPISSSLATSQLTAEKGVHLEYIKRMQSPMPKHMTDGDRADGWNVFLYSNSGDGL